MINNWWALITAQRNLTLLTSGIGQANGVVPLLVAAPAFFAGRMTLGQRHRDQIAYGQVSGALSWFVDAYQEIAAWRASIERLATFADMLDGDAATSWRPATASASSRPPNALELRLDARRCASPTARCSPSDLNAAVAAGERVAVLGPAGLVKTTLFRALAGIWPFGSGRIEMPARRATALPRRSQPYLPIGTLREAVSYPSPPAPSPTRDRATRCRPVRPRPPRQPPRRERAVGSAALASTSSSASPSPARSCTSPIGSFWTTPPARSTRRPRRRSTPSCASGFRAAACCRCPPARRSPAITGVSSR